MTALSRIDDILTMKSRMENDIRVAIATFEKECKFMVDDIELERKSVIGKGTKFGELHYVTTIIKM